MSSARGSNRRLPGKMGILVCGLLLLPTLERDASGAHGDSPAETGLAPVAAAGHQELQTESVVAPVDGGAALSSDPPVPSMPPPPPDPFQAGKASFYHPSLEGRPTASGEPYRAGELTAAHRTLPFGTVVRVVNPNNGRSVVVRINDRGPFVSRRVIDLSKAAARELRMVQQGVVRVKLEIVEAAEG